MRKFLMNLIKINLVLLTIAGWTIFASYEGWTVIVDSVTNIVNDNIEFIIGALVALAFGKLNKESITNIKRKRMGE